MFLTRRAPLRPDSTVLTNGVTGAGGMAVQIARHFDASRTIGAGRRREKPDRLDLDVRIALGDADEALRERVPYKVAKSMRAPFGLIMRRLFQPARTSKSAPVANTCCKPTSLA